MLVWPGQRGQLNLPLEVSPASLSNVGAYIRDIYRLHFTYEVAAGSLKPLIIPYSLLGTFIIPIVYFSIPHVNRPWLYRARFLVMLFILAFNTHETLSSSSANFAVGYGVGLVQAWGILWNATLLIWMSPQFEAERVEKRKRAAVAAGSGTAMNGHTTQNESTVKDNYIKSNGFVEAYNAPDEDVMRSLKEGYEYYWQAYPADAPLSIRLDWSMDLVFSFRGTGWNWCVPVLPHFAKPDKPQSGSLVDLGSIPLQTRQGYRRYTTNREWLRAKTVPILLGYLVLDLLSTLMMKDPYFIFGPELGPAVLQQQHSLPPLLASLPPSLLFLYHSLACFTAILIAIELIMSISHLFSHFVLHNFLGTRSELWHYPCIYGGFVTNVLDKGMAGFWGGWWHQTFRTAFSAPGVWLARKGYINPRSPSGKALAGLIAFAESGFLHTLGSISCLPPSKPWMPAVFFLLCWAGILVQTALVAMLKPILTRQSVPTWLKRTGNFLFVFVYLNACQFYLCDDFARSGIWLLEPVPVSLVRALGFGKPGDSWWRWDPALWPRWYVGQSWWDSGIAA